MGRRPTHATGWMADPSRAPNCTWPRRNIGRIDKLDWPRKVVSTMTNTTMTTTIQWIKPTTMIVVITEITNRFSELRQWSTPTTTTEETTQTTNRHQCQNNWNLCQCQSANSLPTRVLLSRNHGDLLQRSPLAPVERTTPRPKS
uniref:(northern house mosquito) hypothetical protein n=1 Tax=Culex pipiens TaxID=7175 RepID=A0A8D8JYD7_CULPI